MFKLEHKLQALDIWKLKTSAQALKYVPSLIQSQIFVQDSYQNKSQFVSNVYTENNDGGFLFKFKNLQKNDYSALS